MNSYICAIITKTKIMKRCTKCKNNIELNGFYKTCKTKDGRTSSCKKCESARNKIRNTPEYCKNRYLRNKENILIGQKKYNKKNKEKIAVRVKLYYENNKKKWLALGWKQKGIISKETKTFFTQEEFDKKLIECGDVCQICKINPKNHKKGLAVDHDHKTGLYRGILCGFCNTAIAFFKEDPKILENAINYLKQTRIHE